MVSPGLELLFGWPLANRGILLDFSVFVVDVGCLDYGLAALEFTAPAAVPLVWGKHLASHQFESDLSHEVSVNFDFLNSDAVDNSVVKSGHLSDQNRPKPFTQPPS